MNFEFWYWWVHFLFEKYIINEIFSGIFCLWKLPLQICLFNWHIFQKVGKKIISKTFQNNIQKTSKYSSNNSINPSSNTLMNPKLSPFCNYHKLAVELKVVVVDDNFHVENGDWSQLITKLVKKCIHVIRYGLNT